MMLVANSCLAGFLLGSDILAMIVFALHNDLKEIQYQDSTFVFSMLFWICCMRFTELFLFIISHLSANGHCLSNTIVLANSSNTIITHWFDMDFLPFYFPLAFLFTDEIIYDVENQMCQVPLRLSFSILFLTCCIYNIPISLTMLIYFKLVSICEENETTYNTDNYFSACTARTEISPTDSYLGYRCYYYGSALYCVYFCYHFSARHQNITFDLLIYSSIH